MKTKIFKIAFPALALILAITASLAFTSAENSMADDIVVTQGWYQNPNEISCTLVSPINCDCTSSYNPICTYTVGFSVHQVYQKQNSISPCNVILYKGFE
ncbi:DUF6520 family protein [Flavivirga aquimarina]|uniref:DUF6520 family protein n=1 Tax=Flavivirga aquimarina TaxID=2027862 RepID=A0ABT8W5I8_9FLAO|nr:DUF6520 family protein [Flavivirga aquimarina]MDO5968380.1 DUF6520 family protein [Flavivirga aquimarina]